MPAGAASRDDDTLDPGQLVVGQGHTAQLGIALLFEKPTPHDVPQAVGLLVDLLEHVVLVAALLGRLQVPRKDVDRPVHRAPAQVIDPVSFGRQHGVVAIRQVGDLLGVRDHGGRVRPEEVLPILTDAHEERASVAGGHDLLRVE